LECLLYLSCGSWVGGYLKEELVGNSIHIAKQFDIELIILRHAH
jgi:hypothetical protein